MYLIIERYLQYSFIVTYSEKNKDNTLKLVDKIKKTNRECNIKSKIYIIDLEEIEKYDIYKK